LLGGVVEESLQVGHGLVGSLRFGSQARSCTIDELAQALLGFGRELSRMALDGAP